MSYQIWYLMVEAGERLARLNYSPVQVTEMQADSLHLLTLDKCDERVYFKASVNTENGVSFPFVACRVQGGRFHWYFDRGIKLTFPTLEHYHLICKWSSIAIWRVKEIQVHTCMFIYIFCRTVMQSILSWW